MFIAFKDLIHWRERSDGSPAVSCLSPDDSHSPERDLLRNRMNLREAQAPQSGLVLRLAAYINASR